MPLPLWAWVLIAGVAVAFFGWYRAARNMRTMFKNPTVAFDSGFSNHINSMLVMAAGVVIVVIGIILLAVDVIS